MKQPTPTLPNTNINSRTKEWLPASFNEFLVELNALEQYAEKIGSLLLFRGHQRREWRLDSTFARSVKSLLFGMKPEEGYSVRLRNSGDLNFALTSLLLLKYGTILEPSTELKNVESEHGVDSWFELMKRYQQYPKEDAPILQGTNFVDWSRSSDVALYFANDDRSGQGALFVCDATATGKSQQLIPVVDILRKVREQLMLGKANGAPLLFCPPKQIMNQRAKNQQAIYFAQMDLRVDLSEIWRLVEDSLDNETILLKLVLPERTEPDVSRYLANKGVNQKLIYPD